MGAHALILAHFDMIKAQGVAHFSCRSPAGSARGVCGALRRPHTQRHAPRVSVWRDLRVGGQGMSRAAPPYAYGRAWGVCVWGGALCTLCALRTQTRLREGRGGRCAARACVRDCERAGTSTRGAHGVSCVLSPPRCCARCSSGPRSSTAPWRSAARVRALLAASAFGVVGAPARLGDRFCGPSAARTRPHAGVIGANARCGIPARG